MNLENSNIRTIQESFLTLKRGFQLVVFALIIITISSSLLIFYVLKNANEKIYVVSPHQTFLAYASYEHETSIYEARNHIKAFCENIFAWDKDNYKSHVEYGLNLINHTEGLKIFNTFKENQVYENLISTSAKVLVSIDSIELDMKSLPIKGYFYLTQKWQSAGGSQLQKIKAHFELISISRSELNPYGLELQKISFLDYVHGENNNNSSEIKNMNIDTLAMNKVNP